MARHQTKKERGPSAAVRRTRDLTRTSQSNPISGTVASSNGLWRLALLATTASSALGLLHVHQLRRTAFFSVLLGDALSYDAWAQRIASGQWLGSEVFYQSPLYPYVLGTLYAVFGRDLLVARLAQVLMVAVSCGCITAATGRLFDRRAGIAAGFFVACYAPAIFFAGLLQKSALDLLILSWLVLAISLLVERVTLRRCASAGLALGFLALNRENALLLLPVVGGWLWFRAKPKRLIPVLAFSLSVGAVLAPVAVRNAVVGGEFMLTTSQLGPNLYIGNNESANGTYVALRRGHGSAAYERQDATALAEAAMGRELTPAQVSQYWRNRALTWIRTHPAQWVGLTLKKVLVAWNRVEVADTEDLASYAEFSTPLRLTWPLFNFGLLGPLALIGMWCARDRWRELWLFPAMCVAYTASLAAFYVLGRYRLPLVSMLVPFVGVALAGAIQWWRRCGPTEKWIVVAVIGVVGTASNWPVLPVAPMRAVTQFNIGFALQESGSTGEAEKYYLAALRLRPDYPDAHCNLGVLLAARGERAGAIEHYLEAIRFDPQLAQAHANLGIEMASMGRLGEAIVAFRRASELDPMDPAVHFNLGTALASHGDVEGAISALATAVRLQPDNLGARNNLGIQFASSGRLVEASEQFREVLRLEPGQREATANLARVEALIGAVH